MSDCLSKSTILQFLADELEDSRRENVVEHIEGCDACQSAVEHALENQTLLTTHTDSTSIFPRGSGPQSESRFSKVNSSLGHSESPVSALEKIPPGELPEIDGFEMVGEIGRGASGVVYEAVDRGTERRVAIKIISGQLFSQSDLQQRFLREARSVAALNHPNIAGLYQISETSKYGPYLVFEFVDAQPLDEIIDQRGAMNPRRAAEICRGIASAAAHAHDHHVVHRDLKPSNILIEKKSDVPKVIDFGLAVDPHRQSRLTQESYIAGTPAYMSPEQIETPRDIDHGSDIYSLGVILYELLTGDVPFRGLSKQTLSRVVHEEPQPLTKLNPAIPKDLETICMKMLNKSASQRYASMLEFSEEIQRWQQGRPILAKPVSTATRAYRWMLRNPLVASLVAIAGSLLLIIGVGSTIGMFMLSNANALTSAAKEKSDRSAAAAIQQRDQLLKTIDSLVYKVNDDVDLQYMEQEDVQIRMLRVALEGLNRSSQTEQGHQNFEVNRRVGDINLRLASVLGRLHRFDEAQKYLSDAHRIAGQLVKDPNASVECFHLRSQASWEQVNIHALVGDLQQAEFDLLVAEEHERELDVDDMSLQDQLNHCLYKGYGLLNLGVGYSEEFDENETAIKHLQPALELGEQMLVLCQSGGRNIDNFRSQALELINYSADALGQCYGHLKDYDIAAAMDYRASRVRSRLAAFDDGNQNSGLVSMALSEEQGNAMPQSPLDRSELFYQYLIEVAGDEDEPSSILLHADRCYRLGFLDVERHEYEDALEHFRECIDLANTVERDESVEEFDVVSLIVDADLRILELKQQLKQDTDAVVRRIRTDIEKLDSLDDGDYENRILGRIKYEFSLLQNPKS